MTKDNLYATSLGRACRRLLLLALMVLVPATHAAAQESLALDWELVNPFRFIRDPAKFEELRSVYAGLGKKTAANLEGELQKLSERDVRRERDAAESGCASVP